jgi:hypothetical protein
VSGSRKNDARSDFNWEGRSQNERPIVSALGDSRALCRARSPSVSLRSSGFLAAISFGLPFFQTQGHWLLNQPRGFAAETSNFLARIRIPTEFCNFRIARAPRATVESGKNNIRDYFVVNKTSEQCQNGKIQ